MLKPTTTRSENYRYGGFEPDDVRAVRRLHDLGLIKGRIPVRYRPVGSGSRRDSSPSLDDGGQPFVGLAMDAWSPSEPLRHVTDTVGEDEADAVESRVPALHGYARLILFLSS